MVKGPMNSKETAEFLGISRYMLRKLVKEDKIPYRKSYTNVTFHQTILNAWMRGEFINGRVALILEEKIDYEHEDALQEHCKRYTHLKAETKEKELASKPIGNLEYGYEVNREGVHVTVSILLIQFSLIRLLLAILRLMRSLPLFKSIGQERRCCRMLHLSNIQKNKEDQILKGFYENSK